MKKKDIMLIAGIGAVALILPQLMSNNQDTVQFSLGGGGYSTGVRANTGVGTSTETQPTIVNYNYSIPAQDFSKLEGFFNMPQPEINKKSSRSSSRRIYASPTLRLLGETSEAIVNEPTYQFRKKALQDSGAQMTFIDDALASNPTTRENLFNIPQQGDE